MLQMWGLIIVSLCKGHIVLKLGKILGFHKVLLWHGSLDVSAVRKLGILIIVSCWNLGSYSTEIMIACETLLYKIFSYALIRGKREKLNIHIFKISNIILETVFSQNFSFIISSYSLLLAGLDSNFCKESKGTLLSTAISGSNRCKMGFHVGSYLRNRSSHAPVLIWTYHVSPPYGELAFLSLLCRKEHWSREKLSSLP